MQQNILKRILDTVVDHAKEIFKGKLDSVILYGSYARGDYDNESDIDIMMLVNLSQSDLYMYKEEVNILASELSLENDITVSIFIKPTDIFHKYKDVLPFYSNVISEGVIINGR